MTLHIDPTARKTRIELTEDEARLQSMSREQVLLLPPELRVHWFAIRPVSHRELNRVIDDVDQLMEDNNEVSIISVIGLSGVGKTTAASAIHKRLMKRYSDAATVGQVPVLYVEAPADGEKHMSWRALYRRILHAGGEIAVPSMHRARVIDGRMFASRGNASAPELRDFIEDMVRNRGIRALIIDEALHLLRFQEYDVMMDTLKSLSDIPGLKLILIGSYQIAPLMVQYGQVARRSEIVHFNTYALPPGKAAKDTLQNIPAAPKTGISPSDARVFYEVLQKCISMWPHPWVPDLEPRWWHLMDTCLGSVGLLKMMLLRLATSQMQNPDGPITEDMLAKAGKSAKALSKLKDEQEEGWTELRDACYGDGRFVRDYPELAKAFVAQQVPQAANQGEERRYG